MRVTYLLPPFSSTEPIGGYKAHYEYANRLSRRGHLVTIVQALPDPVHFEPTRLKVLARRYKLIARSNLRLHWFDLDERVRLKLVSNVATRHLPAADVLLSTGWQTAQFALTQDLSKGSKVYLVYDWEIIQTASSSRRGEIIATYRDDFAVIATSSAVRETVESSGIVPVATIPCGIDFQTYRCTRSPEERPISICFPARLAPHKGLADAIEATEHVIRTHPDVPISAKAFGPVRPNRLPDWLDFIELPSDADVAALLNECSIFVLPSYYEGWGLPAVEAMACGAALVTYDNGGSRDYAIHERTALVADPRTPLQLAAQISRLVSDYALRCSLARGGTSHVGRYTWESAVDALESALLATVERCGGEARQRRR